MNQRTQWAAVPLDSDPHDETIRQSTVGDAYRSAKAASRNTRLPYIVIRFETTATALTVVDGE